MGYATMDGDTCGGLSPLAGIDKAYLRRWLKWMETDGPIGLGKIPELRSVNRQQPTAELRPKAFNQTDEGDLMPYEVLDYIERLAIRDKMMPIQCFRASTYSLRKYFHRSAGAMDSQLLPTLVSQSMEARTVRAQFPLGR